MLRVANAMSRPPAEGNDAGPSDSGGGGSGDSTRRLADVHVGLPPSKVAGGTVHLVDGSYEYFHYLQVCRVSHLTPHRPWRCTHQLWTEHQDSAAGRQKSKHG